MAERFISGYTMLLGTGRWWRWLFQ